MNKEEAVKALENGVVSLMDSEAYKNWLDFSSKFHNYSLNNQILIFTQRQDASLVAGFNQWKKLGRMVNKGEKGITIFCPCTKKTQNDDGTEDIYTWFRTGYVFDVNQTSGKEIPLFKIKELASTGDYASLKETILKSCDIPVKFEDMEGDTKGCFRPVENEISIKNGMSDNQTIKTLLHEIAHSMVDYNGSEPADNRTREVRAESVAYIVSSQLGIDTSEYSFIYIASWSTGRELKELKENMQIIKDTSDKILENIQKLL